MGSGPRPPARQLSAEGSPVEASQLTLGRERQTPAHRRLSRSPEQALGRALLVPKLLRGVLRRSPARDHKTRRPSTARRGFLPDLKDGVSALENR
jgi:hypothetical protein